MAQIFEDFNVPVQVWDSQTTKDVLGQVNHIVLLACKMSYHTSLVVKE